jgi:DNA polymerase III alpha subunit
LLLLPLDLGDRLLWPDGVSTITPEQVPEYLLKQVPPSKISVTEITPEITRYNKLAIDQISTKEDIDLLAIFPPDWVLPDRYKYELNLEEYLAGLVDRVESDDLYEERVERLLQEISLFLELELHDVLRTLIYIVETMQEQNVVWGVGRGSSCSSYLLYLIGLHEVDAVFYQIEISDFIRPQESKDAENSQNRER